MTNSFTRSHEGDEQAGFTVFWANDGLDEGPILLQKQCAVDPNDTVESLYNRFLFPAGIEGVREAVALIAAGKAPRIPQPGLDFSLFSKPRQKQ